MTECPEQAVSVSHAVEVAAYTREQLARSASFDIDRPRDVARSCKWKRTRAPRFTNRPIDCATGSAVGSGARFMCARWTREAAMPARWRSRRRRTLYDLERFGVHLVASPRHADLLLVTGPVTRNMEIALQRTYDATPEPRIVVAVGACGCSGGIFGEGTYAAVGGVDRVLPVDVYIPGCPPRPKPFSTAYSWRWDPRGTYSLRRGERRDRWDAVISVRHPRCECAQCRHWSANRRHVN